MRSPPSTRPAVAFDLDALEREGERPDVFTFQHGGLTFSLSDPFEIELSDIVDIGDDPMANVSLLVRLLGPEQYGELVAAGPLPQWKIPHLIGAWNTHYGMTDPGKEKASDD